MTIIFLDKEVLYYCINLMKKKRVFKKILNLNDKSEPYFVIIKTTLDKKSVNKILNKHIKHNFMLR
jgi:hypothetical protein